MAIRNIRKDGDELLRKKSREVTQIDDKIIDLLKDMVETLHSSDNGVGLAAPQVGVLKRIVIIEYDDKLYELINPVIKSQSGEQTSVEGCLSVPGIYGELKRPEKVVVEALNPKGKPITIETEGFLAVIFCHEIDHLEGILFRDKAIKFIDNES